jgi:hypothetical protein
MLRTSLGAYVLGCLEPTERRLVDDHVRDCDACAGELRELTPLPRLLAVLSAEDAAALNLCGTSGRGEHREENHMTTLLRPVTGHTTKVSPFWVTFARAAAAIGVTISADVHFELWYGQGFRDIHIIGPLFLLNAIAGIVIAFAVICWRHWLSAAAAAGFGAATLIAFWISVEHGLFGVQESATGLSEVLAEVAEIVALVAGSYVLLVEWNASRSRRV